MHKTEESGRSHFMYNPIKGKYDVKTIVMMMMMMIMKSLLPYL